MEGSLKGFVEECEKHKEIHSEDVTPKSIQKSLMEHKGEYSTISPVEIVKAIGKEVVIKNTWGAIGLKAVAHVEKRDAMVKAYLATLDDDDKAQLKSQFIALGPTILKHDTHKGTHHNLSNHDVTPGQAFTLAACIIAGAF